MTLSTDIYITGTGVTHREVYEKVNDLLEVPKKRLVDDGPCTRDYGARGADYMICNKIGQGFAAIIDTYGNADGSLIEYVEHDANWCEPDCKSHYCAPPPHHVHVDLDTAYGYRGPNGESCSVLHAGVIVALHAWLTSRGCTLHWVNEYSGEVHAGLDGIREFIGNGMEADAWFAGSALPAILAHAEQTSRAEQEPTS